MDKTHMLQHALAFVGQCINSLSMSGTTVGGKKAYSDYLSRKHREQTRSYIEGIIQAYAEIGIFDSSIADELFQKVRDVMHSEKFAEEELHTEAMHHVLSKIDLDSLVDDVIRGWKSV